MSVQKILLVLIVGLLLGQSVLTSADVHLIFEQTDSHHLDHGSAQDVGHSSIEHGSVDKNSGDHSSDDCGHSCHSHSFNPLSSQAHQTFVSAHQVTQSRYSVCYLSCSTIPLFRPPIA